MRATAGRTFVWEIYWDRKVCGCLTICGYENMTGARLFLVCLACICIQAQIFKEGDYLSDYPPFYPPDGEQDARYAKYQKPELVRQQEGTDMTLKCNATSCPDHHKHGGAWEFKACESDYKKVSCSSFYKSASAGYVDTNASWGKPLRQVTKKKCVLSLELKNISEAQNGLYRCIEDGKVIRSYELEIIDSSNRYGGQPPELLDITPSNITINQSMQVIIQCKVYSKQPPVILWFKQSNGEKYDIQYSDKYYNRINTSVPVHAVPHKLNVYLSKLNIYHVREVDSGVYVCVAMTESGKDYKNAVVNVIATDRQWETKSSFLLLFLIPLSFALIPITIWLCYYRKKKKNIKTAVYYVPSCRDRNLMRPMISDRILDNGNTIV